MKPLVALAFGLVLAAGCSGGGGSNSSGSGVDGGPAPSATKSAVADPCAGGPPGCATVGKADVDGDGGLDVIGVIVDRQPPSSPNVVNGPASVTVRVATAGGTQEMRVDSITGMLPGGGTAQDVFAGAFLISRPQGADLVLHTDLGAGNADQFAVIGWRGGGLTRIPPPPVAQGNFGDAAYWVMMESHGSMAWATCDGDASITLVSQSAPTAEGIPIPGGGLRESDHWKFVNAAWTPMGSENVADDSNPYTDEQQPVFRCEDQRR
ncbi:MAG: hypothetical protein QOC76_5062 [Mycobacterium sp.]|jgi:hypothetical protein|nr:hypothetical protein [Mycobacterium sp.]